MLLYGTECWALMTEQIRTIETTEMGFLGVVAGY